MAKNKQGASKRYTEKEVGKMLLQTWEDDGELYAQGAVVSSILSYLQGCAGLTGDSLRVKLGLRISPQAMEKLPEYLHIVGQQSNIGGELSKAYHNALATAYKFADDIGDETKEHFDKPVKAYIAAIQAVNDGTDNGEKFMEVAMIFNPLAIVSALAARQLLPGRKVETSDRAIRGAVIAEVTTRVAEGELQKDAIETVANKYRDLAEETASELDLAIKMKLERSELAEHGDVKAMIAKWINRYGPKKTIELS